MKESKLIEMQNKIKAMSNIIQHLINEVTHLRELGVGSLEKLKLMPGYEDAIEALKKQMIEKNEELKNKRGNAVRDIWQAQKAYNPGNPLIREILIQTSNTYTTPSNS